MFTAIGIAPAALFLTPLLASLPQATLAATIIVALGQGGLMVPAQAGDFAVRLDDQRCTTLHLKPPVFDDVLVSAQRIEDF